MAKSAPSDDREQFADPNWNRELLVEAEISTLENAPSTFTRHGQPVTSGRLGTVWLGAVHRLSRRSAWRGSGGGGREDTWSGESPPCIPPWKRGPLSRELLLTFLPTLPQTPRSCRLRCNVIQFGSDTRTRAWAESEFREFVRVVEPSQTRTHGDGWRRQAIQD